MSTCVCLCVSLCVYESVCEHVCVYESVCERVCVCVYVFYSLGAQPAASVLRPSTAGTE